MAQEVQQECPIHLTTGAKSGKASPDAAPFAGHIGGANGRADRHQDVARFSNASGSAAEHSHGWMQVAEIGFALEERKADAV